MKTIKSRAGYRNNWTGSCRIKDIARFLCHNGVHTEAPDLSGRWYSLTTTDRVLSA